jgi:hypothetical protein
MITFLARATHDWRYLRPGVRRHRGTRTESRRPPDHRHGRSGVVPDPGRRPARHVTAPPPENINRIQPLTAALVFADYKLVGLNASTNNPGDSSGAILTVGGEIRRITSGAAPSLIIQMTDTDYMLPFAGKALHGTMSTTFSNALSSSTRTFTGFYNPSNAPDARDIAQGAAAPLSHLSAGLFLNSHGDTAAAVVVPDAPLFGLTSTTEFSNLTAGADVMFGGSVQVASVPEPAIVWCCWCRHCPFWPGPCGESAEADVHVHVGFGSS